MILTYNANLFHSNSPPQQMHRLHEKVSDLHKNTTAYNAYIIC